MRMIIIKSTFVVGDKVSISERVKTESGLPFGVSEAMVELVGKVATVVRVDSTTRKGTDAVYKLDIDGGEWSWSLPMLESAKTPVEVVLIEEEVHNPIFVERVIHSDPATILFYKARNVDWDSGTFQGYSKTRKVVAKCAPDDEYNKETGFNVAVLKAYKREAEREIRKI